MRERLYLRPSFSNPSAKNAAICADMSVRQMTESTKRGWQQCQVRGWQGASPVFWSCTSICSRVRRNEDFVRGLVIAKREKRIDRQENGGKKMGLMGRIGLMGIEKQNVRAGGKAQFCRERGGGRGRLRCARRGFPSVHV